MNSPLAGKQIVVTRPVHQSGTMRQMLEVRGATVVEFPTIRIEPASNPKPLQQALNELATFDRVLFTSVNGVTYTWQHLQHPWPDSVRVAAIGPATAAALNSRGVTPDFVPSEYVAEALASGLGPVQDQSILLLRASKARPTLVELLRAGGAKVTLVTAYETHVNHPPDAAYAALADGADAVTFTSGSTVEGFVAVSPDPKIPVTAACIGPITAQVAADAGFKVAIVAKTYTTEGLVAALEEYFE
ncbi:MAG: uroporphyrinogen-III synthase [Bacteroidetes bacterium]|nr:uroporphyrinogen-III synthase [Bacteroidota bacterium]